MKGLARVFQLNPVLQSTGAAKMQLCLHRSQTATYRKGCYAPVDETEEIEFPESRKLPFVAKMPVFQATEKPRTMRKMIGLMRGPEPVHNFLMHKQYGLQALTGGRMTANHFEFFRNALLRKFDYDKVFTVWRVEPPWQAVSKKGRGKRMGGGKSSIHHYVTPVKAGRIILELGGYIHPMEAKLKFAPFAENLPFPARFVTQEMLEKEEKEKEWREKNNANPYTFKYVILNNMGGCNNWLSRYDYLWYGEYK